MPRPVFSTMFKTTSCFIVCQGVRLLKRQPLYSVETTGSGGGSGLPQGIHDGLVTVVGRGMQGGVTATDRGVDLGPMAHQFRNQRRIMPVDGLDQRRRPAASNDVRVGTMLQKIVH